MFNPFVRLLFGFIRLVHYLQRRMAEDSESMETLSDCMQVGGLPKLPIMAEPPLEEEVTLDAGWHCDQGDLPSCLMKCMPVTRARRNMY